MQLQDSQKEKDHYHTHNQYKLETFEEVDAHSLKIYLLDLIKKTKINSQTKVLEIASGSGPWGVALYKKTHCNYQGIDLSPALVKYANDRAKKAGVKIKFVEGDATKLPYKDSSFDVVFVTYALHHFPSKASLDKVSAEVHRVLKSGGLYYIFEPNGLNPYNFFWWLKNSPERIIPIGKKWRETAILTANETIIYPWQVSSSLKTKFTNIKSYSVGFVPKFGLFRKKRISQLIGNVIEKTPLLNKIGGSFIMIVQKT